MRPPDNPATPNEGWNQGVRGVLHDLLVKPVQQAGDAVRGRMTDDEAQNFAFEAALGLIPMGRGLKTAKTGIKAYHGSPHDFDRFDMSKIGTGEGAQAYGHGLYFAENEGVAKAYRDTLTPKRNTTISGGKYNADDSLHNAAVVLEKFNGDRDAAMNWMRGSESMKPTYDVLASGVALPSHNVKPGRMYEVNINANPENFIDWDAPLAKQPKLQETIRRVGADPSGPGFEGELTGAEGYRALQNKYFLDQIEGRGMNIPPHEINAIGSQAVGKMAEAGIPGVKYLDQGSRTAGDGSRNYVVFDDKLVDILRKYGMAGLMSGTAVGASQGPLQQLMSNE